MFRQFLLCCLCLALGPSSEGSVVKRSATSSNIVEVYIVVDRQSLSMYETMSTESSAAAKLADAKTKIRQDINYIITQVNSLYTSLQDYSTYSANVRVAIREVLILDSNIFSSSQVNSNNQISAGTALSAFDSYLASQGALASIKYDLAMLYTGFDIVGDSSSTAGYAYEGTVCQGEKATSVVEFDGTYNTVVTTAHEIAHNLGAAHDSGTTGYVMAPSSSAGSQNRWTLSLCSANNIASVINGLSTNCLLEQNTGSVIPNDGITDAMADAHTICKRSLKTTDTYMCMSANLYGGSGPGGDNVCSRIFCATSTDGVCSTAFSSDGLVCAQGKSCKEGSCVTDSSARAANANENCLFGDQGVLRFTSGTYTCANYLNNNAKGCYSSYTFSMCCKSCGDLNTGIANCEYGDRNSACSSYTASASFCNVNGSICCYTCRNFNRKKRSSSNSADPNTPVLTPSNDEGNALPDQAQPENNQGVDPNAPQD